MSRTIPTLAAAAVALAALSACGTAADAGPAASGPPAVPTTTAPRTVPTVPPGALGTLPTTISVVPRTPATTTAAAPAVSRPANGAVVVRPSPRGRGTLEVRNGNSEDAYVTLARGNRADLSVYVRGGQTARVNGVADGSYAVFYTSGSGWAPSQRRFTAGEDGQRFEQRLEYTTSSRQSTIWTLTLNPVPGGTARTDPVDAAGIPR